MQKPEMNRATANYYKLSQWSPGNLHKEHSRTRWTH